MVKESAYKWKLGMFVLIALLLFAATVYYVGKQKNLFGSTFHLKARFNTVSGLQVGNNVRFSGINIGTVDEIQLITDSSVLVTLVIRKEVQQFIKADATAGIGSDGLMGDKVLTITPGAGTTNTVKDNDQIASKNPVEMADIMTSLKTSVDNAGIITNQLAEISYKLNNGNGALAKLISDESISNSIKGTLANLQVSSDEFADFVTSLNNSDITEKLDSTMSNLQSGSKGLSENMEAAQHSFLLRGAFKKKRKADAIKAADAKKANEIKLKNKLLKDNIKNKKDSIQ